MALGDREVASLRRRVEELEGELEVARARIARSEEERKRHARDLEWFNGELASRGEQLAQAEKELGEARRQLAAGGAELSELRARLKRARYHQRRWARDARRLARSRTWRLGQLIAAALRLLTFRRPAPPGGLADLAASIEQEVKAAEVRPGLGDGREQRLRREASWAAAARGIERSRTWRVGSSLVRAFRLFTFRRPATPHGPADLAAKIEEHLEAAKAKPELAASIEPSDRDDGQSDEGQLKASYPNGEAPLVSVVMIFLDAERFITDAIESVLTQQYPNWELLLVDDGSADRSRDVARRFATIHPAIRYLEHPGHENRGKSVSHNLGLAHARGKYLAWLDSDDVWFPDTLIRLVSALEENPQAAMAYGSTEWWRSWADAGQPDSCDNTGIKVRRPNSVVEPPELAMLFLRDRTTVPCTCSALFRTEVVREVGGFEESIRDMYVDQMMYSKIFLGKPVLVIDSVLSRYRQHPNQTANRLDESVEAAHRTRFLRWLSGYVDRLGIHNAGVRAALADAIALNLEAKQGGELAWQRQQLDGLISWYRGERDQWAGTPAPSDNEKISASTVEASAVLTYRGLLIGSYPRRLMLQPDRFDGMRVLEVGCGALGLSLGFTGCQIWGLDPLVGAYRAAGYPIDEYDDRLVLVGGVAEDMPFDDEFFDAVIAVNAIDHVDDFAASAREISRVLRPNGLLQMEVHYHRSTQLEPQELDDDKMIHAFGHLGIRKIADHPAGKEQVLDEQEAITIWTTQR